MGLRPAPERHRPAAPMLVVVGAPRHRLSRRHRRQGQTRRARCSARPASAMTRAGSRCCSRWSARMDAAKFRRGSDILFVGNVGEEGRRRPARHQVPAAEGQLQGPDQEMLVDRRQRGERHHAAAASAASATASTFKGPGGHSYGAFGLVNPAFAMGGAIARLSRVKVPATPKTTYGVGVVRGGTSVNSIPFEVSMDVDMRSESCAELKKLDDEFLALVSRRRGRRKRRALDAEGAITGGPEAHRRASVRRDAEDDADRPDRGRGHRRVRHDADVLISSTDANIPMSMGIPAITIGRAGPAGARTRSTNGPTSSRPPISSTSSAPLPSCWPSTACPERPVIPSASFSREDSMKRWFTTFAALLFCLGRAPRRCHDRADDDDRGRHGGDGGAAGQTISPTMTTRVKGLKCAPTSKPARSSCRRSWTWRRSS